MLSEIGSHGRLCPPASSALRDRRLRDRLALMTSRIASNPAMSFPKLFSSAELEGAYRFFGNPVVTPDAILSEHFDGVRGAVASEPDVLVVHDSSTFSFNPDGERRGLGRVRSIGQAFFAHIALVLGDDGTRRPLGLAAFETWTRGENAPENEKDRWMSNVKLASARLGGPKRLVHVMDREADDFRLFAQLLEGGHRFIIRSAHDRLLKVVTSEDPRKVSEAKASIVCAVDREATLSKRVDGERSPKQKKIHPSRAPREVTLSIGATRVALKRPTTQADNLPPLLELNLVRVWEAEPPEGEAGIEWLLLTQEPIDSVEHLLRAVDRYRARWTIEEFFKALKTGCAFEARQLGDYEGLVNALAVFAPIAVRMLALRTRARAAPDVPTPCVLESDELDVLRVLGRTRLPAAPSNRDLLLAVAALGGHIKWSGEPGWLTISRGFTELESLTRGWRAAKLQPGRDQR